MPYINPEEKQVKERSYKMLLWISMVSMIMVFAGLTSAYIVRMGEGNWLEFALPRKFYFSTVIIIISSITMNFTLAAAKRDRLQMISTGAALTLILGITFAVMQFMAWGDLVARDIFFTGPTSNASGSFIYILSGLHLAHLAGGIIALLVVLVKSLNRKYNSDNLLGIRLCATYWHFLDILWIYLFLFLLFIR